MGALTPEPVRDAPGAPEETLAAAWTEKLTIMIAGDKKGCKPYRYTDVECQMVVLDCQADKTNNQWNANPTEIEYALATAQILPLRRVVLCHLNLEHLVSTLPRAHLA